MDNTNQVTLPDKQTEFEFELATMAIKGKRFGEAAERFTTLAGKTQSAEAWCGLGCAKLGMILDGVTAEEVLYCFEKAKMYGTGKEDDIETVMLQTTQTVVQGLYRLYGDATLAARKASMQKIGAAIKSGIFAAQAMQYNSKDQSMSALMMAGLTAYNFDQYGKLATKAEDCKALAATALGKAAELREAMRAFITGNLNGLAALEPQLDCYLAEVQEDIRPEREKRAIAEKSAKILELKQNAEELRDPDHPFHALKANGLELFRKKKGEDALRTLKKAGALYKDDNEVKEAIESIESKLMAKGALFLAVLFIALGVSFSIKYDNYMNIWIAMGISFAVTWFMWVSRIMNI